MLSTSEKIAKSLKKRHLKESIFKNTGRFSIIVSLIFLTVLFSAIVSNGYSAFLIHKVKLEVDLSKVKKSELESVSYLRLVRDALKAKFPEVKNEAEQKKLNQLISRISVIEFRNQILSNPDLLGQKKEFWFNFASNADLFLKGKITKEQPEESRILDNKQISWIEDLQNKGLVEREFNSDFFVNADSREPEAAGMAAGIIGSFFIVLTVLLFSFPIGVMSALYLEELAPKNWFTDIIEISINNLAAIPSIIFGLLGLVVYLNFFHLPRSSSLVGGLTLFLLALPIIIIAARNSIRTIPSTIKDGALALGASKTQIIFHHILPLSLPGIMTGTILAVSRAIGETAPLLMIGMVAFVANIPESWSEPATAIPVQIYLWSDSPEQGFAEKTAGAIMVLLGFLIIFNSFAVYLRKKFERKW